VALSMTGADLRRSIKPPNTTLAADERRVAIHAFRWRIHAPLALEC
jgi:hypothetical protein